VGLTTGVGRIFLTKCMLWKESKSNHMYSRQSKYHMKKKIKRCILQRIQCTDDDSFNYKLSTYKKTKRAEKRTCG